MTKKSTKAPAAAAKSTPAKSAAKAPAKKASPATATTDTADSKIAKTQIVDLVAQRASLTKAESDKAVSAMLEVVVEALKSGKTVGLPGLGTMSVKATAARTGVRPGTTERLEIPAGKKVGFKVASTLKGSL